MPPSAQRPPRPSVPADWEAPSTGNPTNVPGGKPPPGQTGRPPGPPPGPHPGTSRLPTAELAKKKKTVKKLKKKATAKKKPAKKKK